MRRARSRDSCGFTLVEVLVAISVMVVVSVGVVRLFVVAASMTRSARDRTIARSLAAGKLEQLRSLTWEVAVVPGGGMVAASDGQTNLSVTPPGAGGPGLNESPSGTLDANVHHVPTAPDQLLAFQVLVTTVARERARRLAVPHAWNGEDILMATMRARVAR